MTISLQAFRARSFAGGYEGVTHAGIIVVARDTGAILLAQRAFDDDDDADVAETWEFPGGSLDDGEEPFEGAVREFREEIGVLLADAEVVHGWRAGDDEHYQGFVVAVDAEFATDPDPDEVQATQWVQPSEADTLALRPEVAALDLVALAAHAVSGNEEFSMDETPEIEDVEEIEEPEFDLTDFVGQPIPIHGVIAPEGAESGDSRGFSEGAMTTRPLRIPFRWQKTDIGGHDGAVVVGSVDRVMRKDGLIHWEGLLMATEEANELAELIEFFGRFGVSVDGDRGALDKERSQETGITWFEAVRAAGLTAVAIPAFAEAYVAFGPHPDMPAEGEDADEDVMVAGARAMEFKRGAGWVTNPKETSRLHRYWTEKGQPGYTKIRWGTPGDWTRAKALIGEKIAKNSPEKMKYLNQIISQWHFDALGYWPGELGKPGNAPDTKENRRRAARHAAANESIEMDEEGLGWEAVLVSSATATKALPPAAYFDRHPETGALVVEEPDEFGIRRTYGYAGEWGVCHVGYEGQCVEVPSEDGEFPEFHLGRTKTDQGYINTGLITYKVDHRDAKTILSESAVQQHYDNIAHAWASVRLGVDDNGVWFSGVVLPHVSEEDIALIEAAGQVSGEWKYGALRALQCVNVPGFPVMRSSAVIDENGEVLALVAAAHNLSGCEPTPAERMAALREIDAELRFAALRQQYLNEKGA